MSSGISPSAAYHIGHFRELLTAEALAWGIRQAAPDRQVTHKHVVDDFDPLRRRYDFLPEEYEEYVGRPICLIPDPDPTCRQEHGSYAEHFYSQFAAYAEQMGVRDLQVVRSYKDLYSSGRMAGNIEKAVAGAERIRQVFKEISNRDLPQDWVPLQLLGPAQNFNQLRYKTLDEQAKKITATDGGGHEYTLDYMEGEVKLTWRLDWPARWQVLAVNVEPFGIQEHGAAGGSYQTSAIFCKELFGWEPPLPVAAFANIHLMGDSKKMSSSLGNLVTPAEALSVMPAEVLRYFIVRSRPEKTLYFDMGAGLYRLFDEYSKVKYDVQRGDDNPFKEAYLFAQAAQESSNSAIAHIPFNHLVTAYQSVSGADLQTKASEVRALLLRSGYSEEDYFKEVDVIERELAYIDNWLTHYAPEELKFSIHEELQKHQLTSRQRQFLEKLAARLEEVGQLEGQSMHDTIYMVKDEVGIDPSSAFAALYKVILGQESGPKAGWFLASLDKDWLVQRLKLKG